MTVEQHNGAKVRDGSPESSPDDVELSEAARRQLENAAAGNKDVAQEVEQIQKVDSPAVVPPSRRRLMGRQVWAWRGNVDGSRIVLPVLATLPAGRWSATWQFPK